MNHRCVESPTKKHCYHAKRHSMTMLSEHEPKHYTKDQCCWCGGWRGDEHGRYISEGENATPWDEPEEQAPWIEQRNKFGP